MLKNFNLNVIWSLKLAFWITLFFLLMSSLSFSFHYFLILLQLKEESAASESKFQDSEHRLQAALIKLDSVQADYKRCDHELKVLRNHHQQLQTNATNSSSNALNKRWENISLIQWIISINNEGWFVFDV